MPLSMSKNLKRVYGGEQIQKEFERRFNESRFFWEIDTTSFDTSMAKTMESMFYGCIKLKELDLVGFK